MYVIILFELVSDLLFVFNDLLPVEYDLLRFLTDSSGSIVLAILPCISTLRYCHLVLVFLCPSSEKR
jgi:hypothetical protein